MPHGIRAFARPAARQLHPPGVATGLAEFATQALLALHVKPDWQSAMLAHVVLHPPVPQLYPPLHVVVTPDVLVACVPSGLQVIPGTHSGVDVSQW
jgi:hypothetical protein